MKPIDYQSLPIWPNNECGCGVEHATAYPSLDDKIADTDAAALAELAKPYLGQVGKDDGGVHLFEGALVDDFPEPTRRSLSEQKAYIAEKSALNDLVNKAAVLTNAQAIGEEVGDIMDFGMPKEFEVLAWQNEQDLLAREEAMIIIDDNPDAEPPVKQIMEWMEAETLARLEPKPDEPWIPSEHGIGMHPDTISDLKAEIGYTIKDSGERTEFEGGMVRDTEEGKLDLTHLFDGPMGVRYAEHMDRAVPKYGRGNWLKAQDQEAYDRYGRSLLRHVKQYLAGETDEDHAAAIWFNVNGREYVRQRLDQEDGRPTE